MDRSDEKRDELTDDRADSTYNPLGVGNANPPRDHVPSKDEKVRRDDMSTEGSEGRFRG